MVVVGQGRQASLSALQQRLQQLEDERLKEMVSPPTDLDRGFMMNGFGSPAYEHWSTKTNREGEIAKLRDVIGGGSGELNYRPGAGGDIGMNDKPDLESMRAPQSMQALGQRAFIPSDTAGGSDGELRNAMYQKAMAEAQAATDRAKASGFAARESAAPEIGYHQRKATEQWDREAEQAKNEAQLQMRGATQRQDIGISDEAFFSPRGAAERQYKTDIATEPARLRAEGVVNARSEQNKAVLMKALIDAEAKIGSAAIAPLTRMAGTLDPADPAFDSRAQLIFEKLKEAQATSGVRGDRQALDASAQAEPDTRSGQKSEREIRATATRLGLPADAAVEAYKRFHPNVTIIP